MREKESRETAHTPRKMTGGRGQESAWEIGSVLSPQRKYFPDAWPEQRWIQNDRLGQRSSMLAPGSAAEVTDLSTLQFRYQICPGVLPWMAQSSDAGARPKRDSTTARSPFRSGAVHASDHPMAARESGSFGRRNPAACPARWLSRRQERSL